MYLLKIQNRFVHTGPVSQKHIVVACLITVNRNRMVRLAGPRDKYVIVHFYFWSRDDERGNMFEKALLQSLCLYTAFTALLQYVRMRLNF